MKMSKAITSLPEDQRLIENTIHGIRMIIEGKTRRPGNHPLQACLRAHQCDDIIELAPRLIEVAKKQLIIKRDQQGTKSKLVKRRNELLADLEEVNIALGKDPDEEWFEPAQA
jgi:hypothetical protein